MNSLILCEGKTDCVFLQYFLEKVHDWERKGESQFKISKDCWSNSFSKEENTLIVTETKGCSKLAEGLSKAIMWNRALGPSDTDKFFDKIVIFTDNDEITTPKDFLAEIQSVFVGTAVSFSSTIQNCIWNSGKIDTIEGFKNFDLLIMFIPFDENGALETYLLNCIASKDVYDKTIIDRGNSFIETVDPEERYLNQRRLKTKAKFDVYFSVRTAVSQYAERQSILKSIPWENYCKIKSDFKLLGELG